MINIVVFASGSGSNAENIIRYFNYGPSASVDNPIRVAAVFCNRSDAPVIERSRRLEVPVEIFNKSDLESGRVAQMAASYGAQALILAGFLMKIPASLIEAYPQAIINIHPALLPKYGGKGMYGHHVHEAVVAAGEKESGITIHLADNLYDHGRILFQARCEVLPCDTPLDVAAKIHILEMENFPEVIDGYLSKLLG
ncbi:MAG: phosphoribosylglycinamide formyltransferase [Bacteroidales bacterium]|nr:phosphoribosylglycinamide formyltransferase [Bacteroidales bacterium]